MAVLTKKNSTVIVGGVIFTAYLANYASARFLDYPFMYCWGDALLRPVLSPWASLALFALALVFLFTLVTKGLGKPAFQVALLMFLLGAAPVFAETIFKFGKSCG